MIFRLGFNLKTLELDIYGLHENGKTSPPPPYLHSSKDLIIHVPYFLGHVQDHQNENGLIPLETAVSRERRPLNR